jgi:hypothetical protein
VVAVRVGPTAMKLGKGAVDAPIVAPPEVQSLAREVDARREDGTVE